MRNNQSPPDARAARPARPTAPAPGLIPRDKYAVLVARYRPVEALTKQWIAALREPAAQICGLDLYHIFLEAYWRSWPAWPPYPRLLSGTLDARDLVGFDEVAVATIEWVEASDQALVPGIVALRLLCDDLHTALRAALRERAAVPYEPLWRR